MFRECSSLSFLPDISKWNTNKVNNMSYMFYGCSSLSSLPDISNMNSKRALFLKKFHMLEECPNIIFSTSIKKNCFKLLFYF